MVHENDLKPGKLYYTNKEFYSHICLDLPENFNAIPHSGSHFKLGDELVFISCWEKSKISEVFSDRKIFAFLDIQLFVFRVLPIHTLLFINAAKTD
jgi:hypothetical protein